jgi:hypothetical protein
MRSGLKAGDASARFRFCLSWRLIACAVAAADGLVDASNSEAFRKRGTEQQVVKSQDLPHFV